MPSLREPKDNSMRSPSIAAATPQVLSPFDSRHPLMLGEIPVVVFCGPIEQLGELPGEPTAHAVAKFVCPQPDTVAGPDHRGTVESVLPCWPASAIQPIPGVCFVFAEESSPVLRNLLRSGAVMNEHVATVESLRLSEERELARFDEFAHSLNPTLPVLLLGFGHQGRRLAQRLTMQVGVDPCQLRVLDMNPAAQLNARTLGYSIAAERQPLRDVSAVVYSPQMRHERLHTVARQAARHSLPVFDNSVRSIANHQHFLKQGSCLFDRAADRLLQIDSDSIRLRHHYLPVVVHSMVLEQRQFGNTQCIMLDAEPPTSLAGVSDRAALNGPNRSRRYCDSTFVSRIETTVSLRNRADLGFFAARRLGERLWRDATERVFPSQHIADLGQTSLERLLKAHLDGREIGSTMQTPAQRTILGIAANHYAKDAPIIEIGSAYGGSGLLMAAATDSSTKPLYSIDPEVSTRDIMRFAFDREDWGPRLRQIVKTSDDARSDFRDFAGQIGVVMIDGLHTLDAVERDYLGYSPLVAPGGALIFHDVCPQIYSVCRVIVEQVLHDPRFEMKCLVEGLAVFERRS